MFTHVNVHVKHVDLQTGNYDVTKNGILLSTNNDFITLNLSFHRISYKYTTHL